MAQPIENHGIVGDLRTVALVALDGTVDFMCWPRFDSPSLFASILDEDRGGCFELAPALDGARHRQLYLPDTNVLLTRFLSAHGVAEISDFMAIGEADDQRLIRRVKAVHKDILFRLRCAPRFDYGRATHTARAEDGTVVFEGADGTLLRLRASIPLEIRDGDAVAGFELKVGESAFFILEDPRHGIDGAASIPGFTAEAFKATSDFWREWVAKSSYRGRWRDMVNRSALVLKLLTSVDHGSMVAAPTFGLPETIGGERNWDYRFTWIRDSSFAVYAFLRLGYTEEAQAFMQWLGHRGRHPNGHGPLQLMYGVDGHSNLAEQELDHFRGYRDSRPVRIGNGAAGQHQIDIYGELMDAIYLSDRHGQQLSYGAWKRVAETIEWLVENWNKPDEGIWEVRSGPKQFLHSKLMCWVAFDRALRLAAKRSLPAPVARWTETRDAIYREIHEHYWCREKESFVQARGGQALDAACLLMPLVRFISPTDPRWLSTMRAVERELMEDSLVYRYAADKEVDGLDGVEGTFNMCSFWYVECLARAGDLPKARFYFEKMLGYANHAGLFAEETGPAGEQLGNFPQAFTHLALISAAYYLDRALSVQEGLIPPGGNGHGLDLD